MNITPYAYQKMMYFINKPVEVGGFAILSEDFKTIIDYEILEQESSVADFDFDKAGMSDYLDRMSQVYSPAQCFRVFVHTHPGNSPTPSTTDWETFAELMANYPWFGMLIFAKDQSYYFYVKTTQGPALEAEVDLNIDWSISCEPVDFEDLENQYKEKVTHKKFKLTVSEAKTTTKWGSWNNDWKKPPEFHNPFVSSDDDVKDEIDFEKFLLEKGDLDEDEVFEVIKDKSFAEMTDDEFSFFEKYVKENEL